MDNAEKAVQTEFVRPVYIMWILPRINAQESWRHTSGQDERMTGEWRLLRGARRRLASLALKNINQETKIGVEKNKRKRM